MRTHHPVGKASASVSVKPLRQVCHQGAPRFAVSPVDRECKPRCTFRLAAPCSCLCQPSEAYRDARIRRSSCSKCTVIVWLSRLSALRISGSRPPPECLELGNPAKISCGSSSISSIQIASEGLRLMDRIWPDGSAFRIHPSEFLALTSGAACR